MKKYDVSQFDGSTFVVFEQNEQREICMCGNYDDWEDAEDRARRIAFLLNALELFIQKKAKSFLTQ
jgi:hypothetical protein